jgi:hypothetical protein
VSNGSSSLEPVARAALTRRGTAMQAVPYRQALWVGAQALTAGGLALAGVWAADPELAVSLSLGVGASMVNPRKLWAAPLVTAAVVVGGLLTAAIDWSPIIGAGAVAGLAIAWLLPDATDWLDWLNAALAAAATATLGLWAADHLLPQLVGSVWGAALGSGIMGLIASQALIPLALRFDNPTIPTSRQIQRLLQPAYRPPVFQAIDLYNIAIRNAPDSETRRGMAEVTTWVFRLQCTLQTLDSELQAIDPAKIAERIAACEAESGDDEFTKDRRNATATHLRRLLDHRAAIATERRRSEALVEYALAFLEEARAGLAVARELPGEATPDRLPEVLDRLRTHAASGDARRKTAREMGKMQV